MALKNTVRYFFLPLVAVFVLSCGAGQVSEVSEQLPELSDKLKDTLQLAPTLEDDDPTDPQVSQRLEPIRESVGRINAISQWTSIDSRELSETTEGGDAKFYYKDKQLQKIVTELLGETFRQVTEYYLLEGGLSFVFERTIRYNRPLMYDSVAMRENDDTEVFDLSKSEIIETRSYFEKGKIFYQVSNETTLHGEENHLHKEQERITGQFRKLLSAAKRR